jgi:hypothetical protein
MIHHHLSNRVNSLSESATLQMTRRSRELKDAGIDVINLSIGEPDFDTPESVKAAGIDAIQKNITHYPPVAGFNELRKAITAKHLGITTDYPKFRSCNALSRLKNSNRRKAVFVQQVLNYFGFIILANYRTQISFCS